MQRITPFLWFDDQAEEAANFYVSVFKNSKIKEQMYYTGEEPVGTKGSVMTVAFELDGQDFVALNGGPQDFKFTEAVSFAINCETQEEIDYYWDKLTADGGEEVQCGWLTDKYGLLAGGAGEVIGMGQECRRVSTSDAGADADEETRYRGATGGVCWEVTADNTDNTDGIAPGCEGLEKPRRENVAVLNSLVYKVSK